MITDEQAIASHYNIGISAVKHYYLSLRKYLAHLCRMLQPKVQQ